MKIEIMNTPKLVFYFILGVFLLLSIDAKSLNTINEDPGWDYIWIYSDIGVLTESKNIGINCLNVRVREYDEDKNTTKEYSTQTSLYRGKNGKARIRFSSEKRENVSAEISIEKLDGTKLKIITLPTKIRKFRIEENLKLEDASSLCRENPMYNVLNEQGQNTKGAKQKKTVPKNEISIDAEAPILTPDPYHYQDDDRVVDAVYQELADATISHLEIEMGLRGDTINEYKHLTDSLVLNETSLVDSLSKTIAAFDSLESVVEDKNNTLNYLASLAIPEIPFLNIELMRKVKDNYKRAKFIEDLAMFSIADNELLFNHKDQIYYIILANSNGTIVMLHENDLLPFEEIKIYNPEFIGDKKIDDLYFKFYFKNSFGEKDSYKEIASGGVAIGANNKLADSTIQCTVKSKEDLKNSEWVLLDDILKKYNK